MEEKYGGIFMKEKWSYSYQKGLRGALVSFDCIQQDNDIYFVLHHGVSEWESLLIKLDIRTLDSQILFKEDHVMRSVGVFENNKFYFTTFKGMAYCVDVSGELLWQTDIGGKNADSNILLDEDRLYMSDDELYCLDKNSGNILWINKETECKTNCSFAVDEKYVYHGGLEGTIRCIDKYSGKTIWNYGKRLWIRHCILLDETYLMACLSDGKFIFLDAKTGKRLRKVRANGRLNRKPIFYNEKMYIGDCNDVINSTEGNMVCYEFMIIIN